MDSLTPLSDAGGLKISEAELAERQRADDAEAMRGLRSLLLGPEQALLSTLQRQLAEVAAVASVDGVGRVLPQAIERRGGEDPGLVRALTPAVEQAIESSSRRNPRLLTDAVFPILGPIVRKSIASGLENMIERTRFTLAHTFSLRGLRWRFEAWSSGKSFEDVVLLHSLVYRVEQVFLIHRESGLLLLHEQAAAESEKQDGVQDADLVSGMLTALQDFVRDSFHVGEGESLETVQVGGLTVWIERGPHIVLAAVVRGNAPEAVRGTLRAVVEIGERDYAEALRGFAGDAAPFLGMRPQLERCLAAQYQPDAPSSARWVVVLLLIGLLLMVGIFTQRLWQKQQRERRFTAAVAALERLPGVVIYASSIQGTRYSVRGFRDPQAAPVDEVLREHGIAPADVELKLAPILSLEPALVERRVQASLQPPQTVRLRLLGRVLHASGTASAEWIRELHTVGRAMPGVDELHDEVRELLPPPDLRKRLAELTAALSKEHLAFVPLTATLKPQQDGMLERIRERIAAIRELSGKTDQRIELEIIGYADQLPELEAKNHLGARRAEALVALLREQGLELGNARIVGVGAATAAETARGIKQENPQNWAVGFRATAVEASKVEAP